MVPSNLLQQVVTWNMADLEIFQNLCCFASTANTLFKDPENFAGNLGSSVSYEVPPRFVSLDGLTVNFQPIQQNARTLTVNRQKNVGYAATFEEIVFNNLEEYTTRLGDSAMTELASNVDADIATLCETIPYRFYGNGFTAINSAEQLAQMLANFRAYSTAPNILKVYLDVRAVPAIVGSMQNQFTIDRNDINSMSWMVGNWDGVEYYQSNQLPMHQSGNVGINGRTLTVISTNDPTGLNVTQITVSGADVSDLDAIHQYDLAQFIPVAGVVPMWLQYTGHRQTSLAVQLQLTQDAESDGAGHVVLDIFPALCSIAGNANQNIASPIVAGMQLKVTNSHVCGAVVSDDAMFVAMPKLPTTFPFPSATAMDENSKVSVRLYYGIIPFQNTQGWVRDVIYGYDGVPQNWMRICFPIPQGAGIGF